MNINNLPTLLSEYKNGNGHIEYLIDDELLQKITITIQYKIA